MTLAPGPYSPGTPIRLTIVLKDDNGDGVDPSTVLIKVMSPAGISTTYTYATDTEVGRSSAGNYYADITPDAGGRWFYRWETTGSGTTVTKDGEVVVKLSPFVDALSPPAYRR